MNIRLKFLAILLAIHITTVTAKAGSPSLIQTNTPTSSWQELSDGIALALHLVTETEKDVHKGVIDVYIKNSSKSDRRFFRYGRDSGIQIFYMNDSNVPIPLHDYTHDDDILYNTGPIVVGPGSTLLRIIHLTPDELILIKAHSIKCIFGIYDPVAQKGYRIESSLRQLTETVINADGK